MDERRSLMEKRLEYPRCGRGWNLTGGIAVGAFFVGILVFAVRDISRAEYFKETAVYQGWRATASVDGDGRRISIADTTLADAFVSGKEVDGKGDGRFDEIRLNIPRGHPLEGYARLDSLEAVYAYVAAKRREE